MARPRKEIDKEQFEKLCAMQATKEEICAWFDITDKTLDAWCGRTYAEGFSEVFNKKRAKGKISLRRAGFELAKKNAAVHIFYAKNFLGMTDRTEQVVANVEDLTPLAEMLKDEDTDD
jgi:hypothetical protein